MPDLSQSLQGRDLSYLSIVADLWGVEFSAPDARVGAKRLPALLLDAELLDDVIENLPEEAMHALEELTFKGGRIPWALFTRRFGTVREMGPGRRDREQSYRKDSTPAEALWYRALLGRAFFDSPDGPQEFAYIPDDLLTLLPSFAREGMETLGRPASKAERGEILPVDDRILDDACTYLAGLRISMQREGIAGFLQTQQLSIDVPFVSIAFLDAALNSAGLIDEDGLPQLEATREFLEAPRGEALAFLARAWLRSEVVDELRLMPGLKMEGEWKNEPLRTRQTVLDFISTVPEGSWWSLSAFVNAVRETYADFQRPAGDYDSWFIRDDKSGAFLRGFENWERVDGALIRFMITGPLHWFGFVELAAAHPDMIPNSSPGEDQPAPITAFRLSTWSMALLRGDAPPGLPAEDENWRVFSDGRLQAPRLAGRAARYQLSRFSQWEKLEEDIYYYRLTPASLRRAGEFGLRVGHLLTLLRRHSAAAPSPNLVKALERWEAAGSDVRMERVTILRVSTPELLKELLNSRAARFLGDPVGPTSVIVNAGAWQKVLAALVEMGYLGEGFWEDGNEKSPE